MGAIIGSSTDNKIGMNSATTNSCLMKIQCMNYKFFSLKICNYATSNFLKSKQQANSNFGTNCQTTMPKTAYISVSVSDRYRPILINTYR